MVGRDASHKRGGNGHHSSSAMLPDGVLGELTDRSQCRTKQKKGKTENATPTHLFQTKGARETLEASATPSSGAIPTRRKDPLLLNDLIVTPSPQYRQ